MPLLTTPCLTSRMNPAAKEKLKERYRIAKRYAIKAAWRAVTGIGVFELAAEGAKGEIIRQGRERVASLLLLCCTHVGIVAIPLLTNSTRVIGYVKKAHCITSCIYKCAHDASQVPLVALDFLVFGEYVSSCRPDEYQLFDIDQDVFSLNGK